MSKLAQTYDEELANFTEPVAERWFRCLLNERLGRTQADRVAWFIWTRCTRGSDGTFEVPLDAMAEEYALVWKS
jgi:hypothetical protein